MKTPEQIINEIRGFISNTNPFKFSYLEETVLNSLTELENTLSPTEVIVEEVVDTEQNVLIKNEEGIFEEITLVEEIIVEEPTVEKVVTSKKSTKKK